MFHAVADSVVESAKLSCNWPIPAPPVGQTLEPNKVNVEYTPSATGTPQTVFKVRSAAACDARGGWYYDDDGAPRRMISCPATCSALQADAGGKINIAFGCDTEVIID